MGQKLQVRPGAELVVSIVVRDPAGTNFSPYTFLNPSLLQIGTNQPINAPVLDHIDMIRGLVSGYKTPGAPDYSGEWPRNQAWLHADGTTADLSSVPVAAKNTSAAVIKTFNGSGGTPWTAVTASDSTTYLKMTYRVPAAQVQASQYRLHWLLGSICRSMNLYSRSVESYFDSRDAHPPQNENGS